MIFMNELHKLTVQHLQSHKQAPCSSHLVTAAVSILPTKWIIGDKIIEHFVSKDV
jgi:hypothetical protein